MSKENKIDLNIEAILASSEEQIREQVIRRVAESYGSAIGYELDGKVKEAVDEFFKAEILPSLNEQLLESKVEILKSLRGGILKVAESLGNAMIERAEKNLDSYHGRDMLSKLFAG